MLGSVIATNKLLRLKIVYNNSGYTTTSHNGIFIEPMDVTQTEIEKLPRDRFERPVVADQEPSTDPLAVPTSTSTPESTSENNDNLPF